MALYIVLGILAFLALGGLVYLFLSKKSSRIQKLASLGALILSALVLVICGAIIIFGGATDTPEYYIFPLNEPIEEQQHRSNTTEFLIFFIILVLVFGFIIFLGVREQQKSAHEKENAEKNNNRIDIE